jgi:hypothetical protein
MLTDDCQIIRVPGTFNENWMVFSRDVHFGYVNVAETPFVDWIRGLEYVCLTHVRWCDDSKSVPTYRLYSILLSLPQVELFVSRQ